MRIAEHLLAPQNGCVTRVRNRMLGEIRQPDEVVIQPLPVRIFRRDPVLQLGVIDDAPFARVDEQHFAGLKTAFHQNVLRWKVEHADLGRHHDESVLRHAITRRAQPISIKHCADRDAVGEDHGRGSVPRFHHTRVIFVKRLFLVAHRFVAVPRFGDEHHHRVRE